jgi:lysophospholipase L1-like esterase
VIFQNVLCIGDSQTAGARIGIGYPEALARIMEERTTITWNCINAGVSKETVVDVLRRTQKLVREFNDVFIVCLLAGCNDARADRRTSPETFAMIYRQLINVLRSSGISGIYIGSIPVIQSGFGHLPYDTTSRALRLEYNSAIGELCRSFEISLVDTTMDRTMYLDAVHFNEAGCFELGRRFAETIMQTTDGVIPGFRRPKLQGSPPDSRDGAPPSPRSDTPVRQPWMD